MKKLIFSAILLMSGVAFANAQASTQPMTTPTEQTPASGDYKVVSVSDLNATVQAAIQTLEATYEVKTVEFNDAAKLTRVALISKADQSEKCVILDNDGKEAAEPVAAPEAPAVPEAPAAE